MLGGIRTWELGNLGKRILKEQRILRGKTIFWGKTNFAGKNEFWRGKTNFARALGTWENEF
jgi:hypothetical protein